MPEFLIIRLAPPEPDAARWIVVDEAGNKQLSGNASLVDAAAQANGRKQIVLAPAPDILRTTVDLPVRARGKLLQALPFAMEEQLAEDVDRLHFAAGRVVPGAPAPVAVVRQELLRGWLDELREAGLDASSLYSEADAMDDLPGTAVLFLERGRAVLRKSGGEAVCADLSAMEAIVQLWLDGAREAATGANLLVYVDAGCEDEVRPRLDELRPQLAELEIKRLPDGLLDRMAALIVARPGVNLLQGRFARRSNLGRFWPRWRPAAALLLVALFVLTGSKVAELWRLNRESEALRQSVEQAFRYVFPNVRQIRGDVRAQFESQMRALGDPQAGDSGLFLDTLQVVAAAVQSGSGTVLEAIDYRSGVMELRLRAPDVETLDRIQRDIVGTGNLTAEIQSANADDGQVLGRLRVEVTGA